MRAIDTKTGQQVLFPGAHNDWVLGTVFSKDASHLVSVSRDRSMKLIEVATQRFVDNITSITPGALKGGILSVDRDPKKDELLVGGADGTPKIYRMFRPGDKQRQIGDDFNLIRPFESVPGRIYAVEYSRDGNRILAGSSSDGTGQVRVYDVGSGSLVSKSAEELGPIYAARFSVDGKQIAAAGFAGKVILLDAATGKTMKQFVPVPLPGAPAPVATIEPPVATPAPATPVPTAVPAAKAPAPAATSTAKPADPKAADPKATAPTSPAPAPTAKSPEVKK